MLKTNSQQERKDKRTLAIAAVAAAIIVVLAVVAWLNRPMYQRSLDERMDAIFSNVDQEKVEEFSKMFDETQDRVAASLGYAYKRKSVEEGNIVCSNCGEVQRSWRSTCQKCGIELVDE